MIPWHHRLGLLQLTLSAALVACCGFVHRGFGWRGLKRFGASRAAGACRAVSVQAWPDAYPTLTPTPRPQPKSQPKPQPKPKPKPKPSTHDLQAWPLLRADFFFSLTMICCGAIFYSTLAGSGGELAQHVAQAVARRRSGMGAYPVSVLGLLLLWQLAVATTLASLDRLGRRGTVAAATAATAATDATDATADADSGVLGPDVDAGVGPGTDTDASTVGRLFRAFLPSSWRLSVRRVRRARRARRVRHRWLLWLSWPSWWLSPAAVRLALRFVSLFALPILALEVVVLASVCTPQSLRTLALPIDTDPDPNPNPGPLTPTQIPTRAFLPSLACTYDASSPYASEPRIAIAYVALCALALAVRLGLIYKL